MNQSEIRVFTYCNQQLAKSGYKSSVSVVPLVSSGRQTSHNGCAVNGKYAIFSFR